MCCWVQETSSVFFQQIQCMTFWLMISISFHILHNRTATRAYLCIKVEFFVFKQKSDMWHTWSQLKYSCSMKASVVCHRTLVNKQCGEDQGALRHKWIPIHHHQINKIVSNVFDMSNVLKLLKYSKEQQAASKLHKHKHHTQILWISHS